MYALGPVITCLENHTSLQQVEPPNLHQLDPSMHTHSYVRLLCVYGKKTVFLYMQKKTLKTLADLYVSSGETHHDINLSMFSAAQPIMLTYKYNQADQAK